MNGDSTRSSAARPVAPSLGAQRGLRDWDRPHRVRDRCGQGRALGRLWHRVLADGLADRSRRGDVARQVAVGSIASAASTLASFRSSGMIVKCVWKYGLRRMERIWITFCITGTTVVAVLEGTGVIK